MRRHDNTLYDFSLVSTYLPVLVLVSRGAMCVAAINWLVVSMGTQHQAVLMLCVSVVYIDCLLMHNNQFDRACGHLCLCALSVLTQQQYRVCSNTETVLLLMCDLLWSACASVEVVVRTAGVRLHVSTLSKVVICCMFASTRVALNCEAMGLMQGIFRSTLYYILCSLLLLCGPFVPQSERAAALPAWHSSSVVYICAHVFFVHLYAVIASVAVIVCIHARLVYSTLYVPSDDGLHKHTQASPPHGSFPTTLGNTASQASANTKDYHELITKLQAAKRANAVA